MLKCQRRLGLHYKISQNALPGLSIYVASWLKRATEATWLRPLIFLLLGAGKPPWSCEDSVLCEIPGGSFLPSLRDGTGFDLDASGP